MGRPILIGNVSGSTGDRLDGLQSMLRGPTKVDAIAGDWLSEFNIGTRALERESSGVARYESGFLYSLRLAIQEYKTYPQPLRIVVNAGGNNPQGLAEDVAELLKQHRISKKIAYITGDNVLERIDELDVEPLSTLQKESFAEFRSKTERIVSANVYIGTAGIRHALKKGAEIVVVGRCTDASPVMGLAAWWHGWRSDSLDLIAGSLAAGHLIECGPYVTGGSFAGYQSLGDSHVNLSFPIAEIAKDGTAIIQKQPGQNGIVTTDTVRTQFVYELQGRLYLNPDVVADLTNIRMTKVAPDKVLVTNVVGLPPPRTLKLAVMALAGFQAEFWLYLTGTDSKEKAASFERMARAMINVSRLDKLEFQLCGVASDNPRSQAEATTMLRVVAQAGESSVLTRGRFLGPLMSNQLQGYPALTPNLDYRTADPKPFVTFFPGKVDRSHIVQRCHILGGESTEVDDNPSTVRDAPNQPASTDSTAGQRMDFGPVIRAPLGSVLYGRSGDKGPNVNMGLFFPAAEQTETKWSWLKQFFTKEKLIELMGADYHPGLEIERCEFPNLKVVHFVVHGLLETGVSSTGSIDPLGKGFVEYIRSCQADIPSSFLSGSTRL